ncbi:hypothetical protein [Thermoanaerobacterium sp. RBIITD]|uniref:hypothetical protein n=1 Tax=Thermoanaerobacterium sp. RBIITD TaxID=1550240 RepID=UPI000BB6CDE9|nr:hypothetical protein [Thermoanaerobacterium sp. RBIITD]SNX54051.1 hypothetical protein SAMN05660242_1682 [Thermoanaerobacterium sp. RBIITD]
MNKIVEQIGKINFEGNIIPANWYKHITFQSGKPNLNAIIILAEIVYWYRPTIIRDPATGEIKGYKTKFNADKLQRSYQSFADQFGISKRQAQDAIKLLRDLGLITLEFRTITMPTSGLKLTNVMFIEPVPERIEEITYNNIKEIDDSDDNSVHYNTSYDKTKEVGREIVDTTTQRNTSYDRTEEVPTTNVGGQAPERETNTENTSQTTSETILPDSVSLSSKSSDNKLVTRSKRSLWKSSLWCSDTKIDNLNTDNTPKDTVCILDNNKRDISLNKALDIEHIKPEISLKVPVIEPDISFKELDREPDKEPVNKPVLSTVTMLEDKTGKILNSNLNKPEKDLNNALDMPNDAVKEPDAINVDDLDDDFLKLDDELFESEEYKEFFAMLDAMPNPDDASKASLEMSYSELDRELKTVSNQKPDTSLNAPEREPERNVIMPDADLIELENEPAGMDAEQTLQDSTDLQECLYAEDTSSFTSAAEKTDCDTDSHVLHVLDKADVTESEGNQNADSNADLMLHHFVTARTEQGFDFVPEGEEVNYGYGNWNDYSLEETDDDGMIISSGQFVQDCDAFEDFDGDWKMLEEYGFTVIDEENSTKAQVNAQNASEKDCKDSCDAFLSDLSDDVVKILAKDKLSDADIKILEEAGFSVVGELDNTMQPDAKNVPEKHADSTEQDFVRMLEEAFNAKVIDDAESDVDTASDMPEKHVDNTEQELVKMLENAFNAKVVDDTENDIASVVNGTEKREKLHDVRLTDELDALPESLLSEPEKMLDADKPDEVLVAEVGRNLNEPEKVRIVDHNKLKKVPIDETDSKPDEVRKSKVISLADRRYQKSLRQTDKPEKLLEKTVNRRQSQIAFVNRHTNALQECPSCNADSLTTAVGKRVPCTGFEGLELAVNAGMRKRKSISSGSPPAKEMFRNLLVVSKQKHRNLTFACEGGN